MTSYNRMNGQYGPDNRWLLQDLLRDEWGFDGFVVTDWYAFADTERAIAAGLDLEMPGPGRGTGPGWPRRCAPATSMNSWSTLPSCDSSR